MTSGLSAGPRTVGAGTVIATWWPLAASWLLMGLELPAVSAIMARLSQPTISLAAYGGVVFPLALLIESPIVMLLAASTALSRDWDSYRLVRRYMVIASSALTVLHVLVAFTPLYHVVVAGMLGAPAEILEPARRGLQIMTPWTFSIAYRRFQQGVLIRFGRSWAVGVGTAVRLAANGVVLVVGLGMGTIPGIIVGTLAVTAGVMSEAVFAGLVVRPVLKKELSRTPASGQPLTLKGFIDFYAPLAVTPLFVFLAMPLASAAMSRMPRPIDSLAVWPVINGLVFTMRSVGFALNEVVVALLERPRAVGSLRRFTRALAAATTLLLVAIAVTPLSQIWFARVSALPPQLVTLGRMALWISVLLPALSAYQSWFQGAILHGRRTQGVTESVLVYLATIGLILFAGMALTTLPGLYVATFAMVAGSAVQVGWLWLRARNAIAGVEARDAGTLAVGPLEPSVG